MNLIFLSLLGGLLGFLTHTPITLALDNPVYVVPVNGNSFVQGFEPPQPDPPPDRQGSGDRGD